MPAVHLTRHLYTFFPQLNHQDIIVEASTAGEVVQALERLAPGIGFYI
jgi:molybdopterin synthase sulfur carrier subunit